MSPQDNQVSMSLLHTENFLYCLFLHAETKKFIIQYFHNFGDKAWIGYHANSQ